MSLLARNLQKKGSFPNRLYPIEPPYQLMNGTLVPYTDNRENYITKGYNINDLIYSIVKRIASKAKLAPFGIYKVEDEAAYKQMRVLKSKKEINAREYVTLLKLQQKALIPVKDSGKWDELLKYPNQQNTWADFLEEGIIYKLLTGNKYIRAQLIDAGANKGYPLDLSVLPAHFIEIIATGVFPKVVTGYSLSPIPNIKFTTEEVLHEKYANPNWSINGEQLYGMAPLKAALLRLKKNNSLTQAEASTFQNEGIKGIMHMKNQVGQVDGDDVLKEVEKLKERMIGEWTGTHNRGRIGLSGYEVGYIPIGLTSEEMQIIASSYLDLRFFCNVFNAPSQMFNDPENRTFNTFKESEASLTANAVLPELKSTCEHFNRKGKIWGLKTGQVFDYDVSCFPELQSDVKDTATWTSQLIAISPNEQRELCGLAALPDDEMSEPWIMGAGRVPLSDFQANTVDDELNNNDDESETDNSNES